MMANEGISVADALALRGNNYNNDDGMFGGNGAWWVIILILFLGGGFGNRFGNAEGAANPYTACCTPATAQGVADAFNFNQLDNGIRGLERGLCDGFYGVNQAISNLGYQVQQGFGNVDRTIMQNDFHNQAGFSALANQMASCCCEIGRGQDAIKYDLATNANAILVANERNTDRIINFLTQNEMDKLRTELQSAQFQLSQLTQTSNIVNQLMPVAKPAYITCSPYAAAFGINCGNSCGCA